jgi:antitoxin component YwqK of YwqJK toxin-antitoxin module
MTCLHVFSWRAALAGAALLAALPAWAANCEINGQQVNPDNGATTAGKTGMLRCKDRDSGALVSEQELRDGKYIGLDRRYQNGKLVRERSVNANGNSEGRLRDFAPDGTVLYEATFENGDSIGLSRNWHPNGQLRRASFKGKGNEERASAEFTLRGQLRDLRCGSQPLLAPVVDDATLCGFKQLSRLEFFNDSGQVRERASFDAGKRVRFELLADNGTVVQQQEINGSSRVDRSFSREGVKRREVLWDVNGKVALMVREQEFSTTGTLARERKFNQGELVSEETFYLNGQPRTRDVYSTEGNLRSRDFTSFFDSGKPSSTGRYRVPGRGVQLAVGTHKRFDANGRTVSETVYDDQGRSARERAWDDNGSLLRDDAVFEDGSRKAFAK